MIKRHRVRGKRVWSGEVACSSVPYHVAAE